MIFFIKKESEKIIYFDSKLLFIWKQNIGILQNCPAFSHSFSYRGIKGVHGAKLCTRASKNLATPLTGGHSAKNRMNFPSHKH